MKYTTKEEVINYNILKLEKTDNISDGYHTFGELYDHRIRLFIELCRFVYNQNSNTNHDVWASKLHADGSSFDGWFIMGINKENGKQISYHLPMKYWDECYNISITLEKAPEFDGHTSDDVLKRLKNLYNG